MNPIRTFVSFSSKDHPFIRHLLARLFDQELSPWDYSSEGQEIPAGGEIKRSLFEKIAETDLFLPIVSDHSCSSSYCGDEVQYALDQRQHLRIVPMVDSVWLEARTPWPGAYSALQKLRCCRVDLKEPLEVEPTLAEICQQINTPYHPPLDDIDNLPFMSRLYKELEGKIPKREERENSIYRRLMNLQTAFVKVMNKKDYHKALEYVTNIITALKIEFPDTHFYFPYVAQAVCQISCGQLDIATTTLEELRRSPLLDENVFGALGLISSRQGQYLKAMEAYQEALRRDPEDIAALYGVVLNALFCGEVRDLEAMRAQIASFSSNVTPPFRKLKALMGLLLLKSRRLDEAEEVFRELANRPDAVAGAVVHWADALVRQGRESEALTMLVGFWDRLREDSSYLEQVARVALFAKDFQRHVQVLDVLAARYPDNRKHIVKKACVLWWCGEKSKACTLAEQVLDSAAPKITPDDYYYNGMASWMLGRRDIADFEFRFSKKSQEHHYSHWIPLET